MPQVPYLCSHALLTQLRVKQRKQHSKKKKKKKEEEDEYRNVAFVTLAILLGVILISGFVGTSLFRRWGRQDFPASQSCQSLMVFNRL